MGWLLDDAVTFRVNKAGFAAVRKAIVADAPSTFWSLTTRSTSPEPFVMRKRTDGSINSLSFPSCTLARNLVIS